MFKQVETKNKDEGFVNEKGEALNKEETKKVEEPKNPDDIDLKAEFEYQDSHLESIEKARIEFSNVIKKQNLIKWVSSGLSIGLLLFSFMYLVGANVNKILGYCLIAVSVAIMIAYYLITKKINNRRMVGYLKEYYANMNAYVFAQDGFSEVNGDIEGKISDAEFNSSRLYKNIASLGSRNVVNFKINQKYDCKMCDCAAQISTMQKLEPVFIGKYIIAPNTYDSNDDIIVYLTGNSRALPPNNVEQLPKAVNTKKMIIYTNNKNYESFLNAKARQIINQIITNNVLVDVSISITKGTTYIGLGYDDCLMVLPLQSKFNPRPSEKFKKDMVLIRDLIDSLNK